MILDLSFFDRCLQTLEKAHFLLLKAEPESLDYELYRSACIKEFELLLEQAGKLLRKKLKPYFHSPSAVDRLYFKDVFREGVHRGLLTPDSCERWMAYWDNRNSTAHDYGVGFAEETIGLLPAFMMDARELAEKLKQNNETQG